METLRNLMKELHVSSVYWVDDDNTDWQDLPIDKLVKGFVRAWSDASNEQHKSAINILCQGVRGGAIRQFRGLGRNTDEDDSTFADRVESTIVRLVEEDETLIGRLRSAGSSLPLPFSSAERESMCSIFSNPNGSIWSWKQWSFEDWLRDGHAHLTQHSPECPGLFIIDLQNRDKTATVDGRAILGELAGSGLPRDALHVLVLTDECGPKEEFKLGRKLTTEFFNTAPLQMPVFVMAKARLGGGNRQRAMGKTFADLLSRIVLSSQHRQLKGLLTDVFRNAVDETFQAMERFSIEEFMYAVTHRSETEGVPEIDTLIRIIGIEQRRRLHEEIAKNENVHRVLTRIRATSGTSLDKEQLDSDEEIQSLRAAELYDSAEVVNKLRSPLSAGDLFAITESMNGINRGVYCLVANLCDLTLRKNGTRKAEIGLLLPLKKLDAKDQSSNRLKYFFEKLPATVPGEVDGVLLNSFLSIDLNVLDLCWTNNGGNCRWSAFEGHSNRPRLSPSQEARLKQLDAFYRNNFDMTPFLAMQATLGNQIQYRCRQKRGMAKVTKLNSHHLQKVRSPASLTSIDFGIQRIGRLSHSHASHLVAEFADALGRASRMHDFSGV